jgi:hypothetical protein
MVITILEAHIASHNEEKLISAYMLGIEHLDQGIVETFLVKDTADTSLWRILTVWKDREALDAMRTTGLPPRGVLMFKEAEASPKLTILDVTGYARA